LNDENNDEFINIDVNEINMLHKEQEFGDKDTHSRKQLVKNRAKTTFSPED